MRRTGDCSTRCVSYCHERRGHLPRPHLRTVARLARAPLGRFNVTARRTGVDRAHCVMELIGAHYLMAEKIVQMLGQLNTHTPDRALSIIDSCPIPVCRFARAPRCRRSREYAPDGKDELVRQTYHGPRFRHPWGSMRIRWPGVITGFDLVPANEPGCPLGSILPGVAGWALGDRGYWKEGTIRDLASGGLRLLAPYRDWSASGCGGRAGWWRNGGGSRRL